MCDAGEGTDIESGLHLAFKKLKVDPEWDAKKMLTPNQKKAVHHLWIRKEAKTEMEKRTEAGGTVSQKEETAELEDGISESQTALPKLKIAVVKPTRRSLPYPKTDSLSLTSLSFSDEPCQKKSCSCHHKNKSSNNKGLFLNYARACVQSKYRVNQPIVHQARFRLHNNHKDHKSVIRAARLKIHKSHTANFGKTIPRGVNQKQAIFGANHDKNKDLTFSALAANSVVNANKSKESAKSSDKCDCVEASSVQEFSGNSFEKHRSVSVVTPYSVQGRVVADEAGGVKGEDTTSSPVASAALDLSSLTASLPGTDSVVKRSEPCPLHPRRCPRPCTCATQARLDPDDLTVEELACYFEDFVHIPKKMSSMAEMMYT